VLDEGENRPSAFRRSFVLMYFSVPVGVRSVEPGSKLYGGDFPFPHEESRKSAKNLAS
jgi:hypothetical protein